LPSIIAAESDATQQDNLCDIMCLAILRRGCKLSRHLAQRSMLQ
jgi:hypothetical protein